ncbi:MAG: hypothetical protein CM15mP74_09610 [Halieaceae bacterium]|nr:MAG: hypothetical protein CM15mP74_09610 [Halieaceae bacterium]
MGLASNSKILSMKLRSTRRNKPDDTFGWGIVFSDQTVDNITANDPVSAQRIVDEFIHWDLIDCHVSGEVERSGGHGFIGLGRKRFLQLLHERARELGVGLHFEQEIELADINTRFADADLIVASDGLNSKIRNTYREEFGCKIEMRPKNSCGWEPIRRFGTRLPSSLSGLSMAGFGPMLISSMTAPPPLSSKQHPRSMTHWVSRRCHMKTVPRPAARSSRTTSMVTHYSPTPPYQRFGLDQLPCGILR